MKKVSRINLRRSLFLFRLQGNTNHVKNTILKNLDLVDRAMNKNREEIRFADYISKINIKGTSQFYQDLFVTYALKNKENGFFVEFGACDGVHLSNIYLLEKNLIGDESYQNLTKFDMKNLNAIGIAKLTLIAYLLFLEKK